MKTFINSRNLSGERLCEMITNAFPELHCSMNDEITIRRGEEEPALITICMQGNYGKVDVNIDTLYTEKIFELIGHSLTKNYDYTKSLITFAEQFQGIPDLRIELINDYNLAIIIHEEIALRLKLWLKKNGLEIEIHPNQNDSGRLLRKFIEQNDMISARLEILRSGHMVKYISEIK
ncbi:hypothetical protein ACVWYG_000754 [Pedobacter sp. UYEF25]